jgi:ribonuclease E
VIDQTEALVAIDVNSGRSTRERGIEETALRTNLEAADEVARQLRLRDLAGLIVIDFIDMESKKHNAAVERRMKDALRDDRARIQLGSISHFGLLEMSRQRLRPSVAETSQSACPHCGGTGHVRSTDSAALHVLRAIEDEGSKRRAAEIMVHVAGTVAMFILNHKRVRLMEIEQRTGMKVCFSPDDTLLPGQTRIDKLRSFSPQELPPAVSQTQARMDASEAQSAGSPQNADDDEPEEEAEEAASAEQPPATGLAAGREDMSEEGQARRRKRRRRRGGRREDAASIGAAPMPPGVEQRDLGEIPSADFQADSSFLETLDGDGGTGIADPDLERAGGAISPDVTGSDAHAESAATVPGRDEAAEAAAEHATPKPRSRRGGRRRTKVDGASETTAELPRYAGPTPADPFANVADIFDILERAEQHVTPSAPQPSDTLPVEEDATMTELFPPPALSEAVAPVTPADMASSMESVSGSGTRPVVIGAGEPSAAEPKRGWWRR